MKERESEKAKLEVQEKEKRTLVANLKKKQQGLQSEIRRKKTEANRLNARIDRLIAEEIEKARKRAEEEARREAEARRKAAEAKSTSKESEAKKSDSRKSSSSRKRAAEKPM